MGTQSKTPLNSKSNAAINDAKEFLNTTSSTVATLGQVLPEFIDILKSVDVKSPEAKLNATSIDDGKGGRIELTRELKNKSSIKK